MENRLVLSVDTELFTQTPAYRAASGTVSTGAELGLSGVEFLLSLFDDYDVSATFFVVSSLAEDHPELVRRIERDGHEIASHGHTHQLLTDLSSERCREEVTRSRAVLERITGGNIEGFRAPAFDRPDEFFAELDAAGYRYDSSIVSARNIFGWYGGGHDVHKPVRADRLEDYDGELLELPVSVMPGVRFPISGAWTRLLGRTYMAIGVRWLQRKGLVPVLYIHPWELVDLPPVAGVPSRVYWRTGSWMRQAVGSIVSADHSFVSAGEVVRDAI